MEKCPLCGAAIDGGVDTCNDRYFGEVLAREYDDPEGYGSVHLLTVDSYALQHSESHSPRSNAYHLVRLGWLLFCNGDGSIRQANKGPMPYIMEHYYLEFPFLAPPPAGQRGSITVLDIFNAKSPGEHIELSRQWGIAVWDAFKEYHEWVKQTLEKSGVKMNK